MSFNEKELLELIYDVGRVEMELEEVEKILSNDNANLMDDLSLDSFLMVELIVEIETTFDIEFDMNYLNINKSKKKEIVDTISAVYILETYMGKQNNK